jgi:hypothetical protein
MARKKSPAQALPREVLGELMWAFVDPPFATRAEFEEAVRAYQEEMGNEDAWRPAEVVIPRPQVKVMYWDIVDEEEAEQTLELTADNGASFTAGELLFKVHNATTESLSRHDHHCFEGFHLRGRPGPNEVPRYDMGLGS